MDLKAMQQAVDQWVEQHGGYWPVLSNLARLTEETGEVARAVNVVHGAKPLKPDEPPPDPGEELADVLWVLLCLSNQMQVDLDASFSRVLTKLSKRGGASRPDSQAT